jgi:hypothetical protein
MWFRIILMIGLLFAAVKLLPHMGPNAVSHRQMSNVATDPRTGHTYEVVWSPAPLTWEDACAQAEARQWGGVPGHLATITSEDEEDFLRAHFWNWSAQSLFIGASDADEEGVWKWVTGPEAGSVFFRDGRVADLAHANWSPGEPNNTRQWGGDGEHYAVWNWQGQLSWNDEADDRGTIHGFLVEYSPPMSEAKPPQAAPVPRHTYLIREAQQPPPPAAADR